MEKTPQTFFDSILLKVILSLIVFLTPLTLGAISYVNDLRTDVQVLKQRTDAIDKSLEKTLQEIKLKIDLQSEEIIKLRIAVQSK